MKRNISIFLVFLLTIVFSSVAIPAAQAQTQGPGECIQGILGDCTGAWAEVEIEIVRPVTCPSGQIDISGMWFVDGPGVNGAYIEYYINGRLVQSEHGSGPGGGWSFIDTPPISPGLNTFTIKVYPKKDSTICFAHGATASITFYGCPQASLSCRQLKPYLFRCTGTASGGKSPYNAYWKDGDNPWTGPLPAGPGPFEKTVQCFSPMLIQFKVRDANGSFSNIAQAWCGPLEP